MKPCRRERSTPIKYRRKEGEDTDPPNRGTSARTKKIAMRPLLHPTFNQMQVQHDGFRPKICQDVFLALVLKDGIVESIAMQD